MKRTMRLVCGLMFTIGLLATNAAQANDIVVKSVADADFFNCTLRVAIANHNARSQVGTLCPAGSGNDRIFLQPPDGSPDIFLNSPLPVIFDTLEITTRLPQVTLHGAYFSVNGVDSGRPASLTISGPVSDITGRFGEFNQDASLIFNNGTFSSLILSGNGTFSNNNKGPQLGGVIFNQNGTVTISGDTKFTQNTARQKGGAIYSEGSTNQVTFNSPNGGTFLTNNTAGGAGGAIYIDGGVLNVTNIACQRNSSVDGPCIFANNTPVQLSRSTFTNNQGAADGGGRGGALTAQNSPIQIINSLFLDNGAGNPGSPGCCGLGGAIYTIGSSLNVNNMSCNGNTAKTGGCVYAESTTSVILNDLTCRNNSALKGGCVAGNTASGGLQVTQADFGNNSATQNGQGGAVWLKATNATISNSGFSGNDAGKGTFANSGGQGGAFYVDSASSLSLTDTQCTGGSARFEGGCVYNAGGKVSFKRVQCAQNATLNGGCVDTAIAGGTLNVDSSQILQNRASSGSRGGGLDIENSIATISNSTISQNTAGKRGDGGIGVGGGIYADSNAQITITGTTLANNDASTDAGGGADVQLTHFSSLLALNSTFVNTDSSAFPGRSVHSDTSAFDLISTTFLNAPLLAENGISSGTVRNSIFSGSARCIGNLVDGGHNLQYPRPAPGCTKTIPVVDPKLDPAGLKNNGGPTQTVALRAGSPAIDAVPNLVCTDQNNKPLSVDQRGFPRPDSEDGPNGPCDIGAFESGLGCILGGGAGGGFPKLPFPKIPWPSFGGSGGPTTPRKAI